MSLLFRFFVFDRSEWQRGGECTAGSYAGWESEIIGNIIIVLFCNNNNQAMAKFKELLLIIYHLLYLALQTGELGWIRCCLSQILMGFLNRRHFFAPVMPQICCLTRQLTRICDPAVVLICNAQPHQFVLSSKRLHVSRMTAVHLALLGCQ